jgi:stage III sporulation protein AH
MNIIDSTGLTDVQKQEAVDSMVKMTDIAEKESAAEILLEAKGFSDVVVSINGDEADVVVNAAVLTDAQRAQIEDIVKRKTDIEPENIIISTIVE